MSSLISIPTLPLVVIALICGILSFISTRLVMPWLIRKLEKAEIIGKDIHKSSRPIVAEMGGIGILFGFVIGIFAGIILFSIPVSYCSCSGLDCWNNRYGG